jgi:hypothetical protein
MNEYGNANVLNMKLKAKCQRRKPCPRWEEQDKKDVTHKEGRIWEETTEFLDGRDRKSSFNARQPIKFGNI